MHRRTNLSRFIAYFNRFCVYHAIFFSGIIRGRRDIARATTNRRSSGGTTTAPPPPPPTAAPPRAPPRPPRPRPPRRPARRPRPARRRAPAGARAPSSSLFVLVQNRSATDTHACLQYVLYATTIVYFCIIYCLSFRLPHVVRKFCSTI